MEIQVNLSDIIEGMDAQSDEMSSYLNLKTGKIVMISEHEFSMAQFEEEAEELSEWEQEAVKTARGILESDDYVELPSKWDIHEYRLMERFCQDQSEANLLSRPI